MSMKNIKPEKWEVQTIWIGYLRNPPSFILEKLTTDKKPQRTVK
jgi:hypothetical protein